MFLNSYTFPVLFAFTYSCVNCWVFNNINDEKLRLNNLLNDDDESLNEINPKLLAKYNFNFIYPGTKWCGAGNIAANDSDLGTERETDACCRTHDMCPDVIDAGSTKYNLTNVAFYSRLSCECDETLRRCLHTVNTDTSNAIGSVYFNLLGTQCFRIDYPVTGCVKRGGWLKKKCLQYSYDTSGEQYYQWFDVPKY